MPAFVDGAIMQAHDFACRCRLGSDGGASWPSAPARLVGRYAAAVQPGGETVEEASERAPSLLVDSLCCSGHSTTAIQKVFGLC